MFIHFLELLISCKTDNPTISYIQLSYQYVKPNTYYCTSKRVRGNAHRQCDRHNYLFILLLTDH